VLDEGDTELLTELDAESDGLLLMLDDADDDAEDDGLTLLLGLTDDEGENPSGNSTSVVLARRSGGGSAGRASGNTACHDITGTSTMTQNGGWPDRHPIGSGSGSVRWITGNQPGKSSSNALGDGDEDSELDGLGLDPGTLTGPLTG
jgi:hypothetical protein